MKIEEYKNLTVDEFSETTLQTRWELRKEFGCSPDAVQKKYDDEQHAAVLRDLKMRNGESLDNDPVQLRLLRLSGEASQ